MNEWTKHSDTAVPDSMRHCFFSLFLRHVFVWTLDWSCDWRQMVSAFQRLQSRLVSLTLILPFSPFPSGPHVLPYFWGSWLMVSGYCSGFMLRADAVLSLDSFI